MERSEQINEIAAALAKAQGAMEGAAKDSANPFFKSKYADLASVWGACRGPLAENGIAVIQSPSTDGPLVTVRTLLVHSGGQWFSNDLSAMAKDDSPQAIGSIVTYLRRYSLQSLVGVAPEDDDAEAAQGRGPSAPVYSVSAPPPASGPLTVKQVSKKTTKNPRIFKYIVVLSDGREVTTIRDQMGALAEAIAQDGSEVTVDTKTTPYGEDLLTLRRVKEEATAPALPIDDAPPLTDRDIPF